MSTPINIKLIDTEAFIKTHGWLPVTSSYITEPSTTKFHAGGLYSESIFGAQSSPDRLTRFGYIDLHCSVMHPVVFKNITRLKRFYEGILDGTVYATFDTEQGDFVPATADDPKAKTGFEFFMKHMRQVKFPKSTSMNRNDKIEILERYDDAHIFMSKLLVIPAGIRDYRVDASGRASVEEINKLYGAILRYAMAIPAGYGNNPTFDMIRLAIQRKIRELYEYLQNLLSGPQGGKEGFLQKKWGSRAVALSARDVISAASMASLSPDDPKFHRYDETKVPLFLAAKLFEPATIFHLKRIFFQHLINTDTEQMSMINPKTLEVEYRALGTTQKDKLLGSDGLSAFINQFEESATRADPVKVRDDEDNVYYTHLVYDDTTEIYVFRSISAFKAQYTDQTGKPFDINKVHPITQVEMLTIATWAACYNRFAALTRYPVVGIDSTYVSRVHLVSTDPSRTVRVKSEYTADDFIIPEYPILGNAYVDSVVPHPSRLKGLGGDHDGDTISIHSIMSDDACKECDAYLRDVMSIVTPNRSLVVGGNTDLLDLVLFNMMRVA